MPPSPALEYIKYSHYKGYEGDIIYAYTYKNRNNFEVSRMRPYSEEKRIKELPFTQIYINIRLLFKEIVSPEQYK